jgi:DNA-binding HxlR family transcriptional regulator
MQGDDLFEAVQRVGDRWTLLLVEALRAGPRRYGELEAEVAGIAPNVLARRLRALESDGLVVATPYQQRPVRMRYELTAAGQDLAGVLDLLRQWGAARRGGGGPRHEACGGELELRLWCPTCERPVDADDAGEELLRL